MVTDFQVSSCWSNVVYVQRNEHVVKIQSYFLYHAWIYISDFNFLADLWQLSTLMILNHNPMHHYCCFFCIRRLLGMYKVIKILFIWLFLVVLSLVFTFLLFFWNELFRLFDFTPVPFWWSFYALFQVIAWSLTTCHSYL